MFFIINFTLRDFKLCSEPTNLRFTSVLITQKLPYFGKIGGLNCIPQHGKRMRNLKYSTLIGLKIWVKLLCQSTIDMQKINSFKGKSTRTWMSHWIPSSKSTIGINGENHIQPIFLRAHANKTCPSSRHWWHVCQGNTSKYGTSRLLCSIHKAQDSTHQKN